ncbi:MAG: peptidylprolyl isomerase [Caulobacterales bacterium]
MLHGVRKKLGSAAALGLCLLSLASGAIAAGAAPVSSAAKPSPSPAKDPTGAVEAISAIVNEDLITTYDVRQRMLLIIASTGIQPTEQNLKQIQDQALRSLIEENLQLQEAKKYDVKVTDKEVNASIAAIAQQNGTTMEVFQQNFAKSGINLDGLRQQLRADMAWRRIVNGRYGSRVRVSQERVKETLARIEASASKPQYLVSEIYLYAEGPTEQAQAQQAAARLLEEMKKGAPFPVVARQFSSAPSAAVGGDLGWMRSGELRPEIETAVQNMQPGFVSEPIPVSGGVYLVALRDKRMGQSAIERVTIKGLQITSTDTTSVKALERVRKDLKGCDSMDAATKRLSGASVVDFGELALSDLTPEMQNRISSLQAGQATNVFTEDGVPQLVMMCSRRKEATGLPTAEEVESRLYEQELTMIARRWLRDLRRDSTIITR